ncbi:hypothetical protein Goklo_024321 [Gossypium klotzschianum]|uniref:NB-ARC domain-containing protein n=1 Tax=Gossypium klotzschianum TaxID=34286 RepID=A0A7J8W6Q4_9ROSI|nr:hypothetical protein [Gossypium klotzschianum]
MKEVYAEGHFPESLLVNDPSTIAVNLPTTKLVGTANVREEIYQFLMGDDVGMIGVWGMGRIGKTTIMKDVHNRLLKERKFIKLIWLIVSKELDIPRLQKNISSQLERNFSDDEDTIIRAGKDAGNLKPTSENGCKLVLTALLESIVRSMEFKKVRVPCHLIEEAINLFLSKVRRDMLTNPTLESFMKLVVRECDGLPLAIVTLVGCMRGVIDPCVWENAIDELREYIKNIRNMKDKAHGCLKFNYECLKQRDREFFLYCALYLKHYKIEKNELIEHWMEEGIVDEMESRKSMESSGYSILQNLEENCLLERVERDYHGSPSIYKNNVHMHDVVKDIALHITWKRFMSLHNSISSLEKLEVLVLNFCFELESFLFVLKLQALKKLNLLGSNSMKLVKFDGIEINFGDTVVLSYGIEQLRPNWCKGVKSLSDIGLRDATDLKKILVETCNELEVVFSSKCHLLQTLESLILEYLLNLNVIVGAGVQESSVGTFSLLKVIAIVDCHKIKKLLAAD